MTFITLMTYAIHIVICIFLILVVLLQQGKGADLSVFGGGASQAAFGARGAANIFQRLTVVCFVGFIVTTLAIGFLQNQTTTLMDNVEGSVPAAAATETDSAATDAAEETGEAQRATPEAAPTEAPAEAPAEGTAAPTGDQVTDPPAAEDGAESGDGAGGDQGA